jgi:ribosomal protein S18 acetylase RimI-like enzyme
MVGYIKCILDMGVLHLDSIIIAEKYRGQGIAKQLMMVAQERGKAMGAHKFWLETGSTWKARGFYEKLGFQVRANLNNYYAHQDFVLMDKDL